MEWWQSVVLGLVEGITEYLPVSSTGHLILAQRALGMPRTEAVDAYAICIQAGAILAVIGLYRQRVARMGRGLAGRDPDGRRLAGALVVAFLPAAVAGFLFDEPIERVLFGLWPVVAAWAVGGAFILWLSARNRRACAAGETGIDLDRVDLRIALIVGFAQCVALLPGTSRSLATIAGGLLAGLSLGAAVEFSFLLGLVTLSAATGYKALGHGEAMVKELGAASIAIGFAVATVSAALAVKWLVGYLNRRDLSVFGWYRLGLAAAVAGLMLAGVL